MPAAFMAALISRISARISCVVIGLLQLAHIPEWAGCEASPERGNARGGEGLDAIPGQNPTMTGAAEHGTVAVIVYL